MSKINDGGSAFPVLMKVGEVAKSEAGMTLRDWFAGQALVRPYILMDDGSGDRVFPMIASVHADNTDEAQWQADARLIAAAPDLLAALKRIASANPRDEDMFALPQIAADAIAKAEDRS